MIVDAWAGHLRGLPFPLLTAATPSRGRSLRNLTVNVFHPFELLPVAYAGGRFDWDPEDDAAREAALADGAAVCSYASAIAAGWRSFLAGAGTLDSGHEIASPRGPIAWPSLLAQQRWHAAFHYRQVTAFLADEGRPVEHPVRLDRLDGLDLPAAVF